MGGVGSREVWPSGQENEAVANPYTVQCHFRIQHDRKYTSDNFMSRGLVRVRCIGQIQYINYSSLILETMICFNKTTHLVIDVSDTNIEDWSAIQKTSVVLSIAMALNMIIE